METTFVHVHQHNKKIKTIKTNSRKEGYQEMINEVNEYIRQGFLLQRYKKQTVYLYKGDEHIAVSYSKHNFHYNESDDYIELSLVK